MCAMGKALYRKYRSKSLNEVIGQEHITTALANALASGTISHAYLFTGPRGVGKTSVARILAHAVNELTYYGEDNNSHFDIIEIDAASNRRIDEIRELRDKVHVAPSAAKYKVYIIDEVHMLTKEAFNALLKTLEEPPAHVIFILATTEAHKVPDTITSRTQRFVFKPISHNDAIKHLRNIANKENIAIDDDALSVLAEHGGGSFRDSISMLDQVRGNDKTITVDDVQRSLGMPPSSSLQTLIKALDSNNPQNIADQLDTLYTSGYQPTHIAHALSIHLRNTVLAGKHSQDTLALLQQLSVISNKPNAKFILELALFEYVLSDDNTNHSIAAPKLPKKHLSTPKPVLHSNKPSKPSKDKPNNQPDKKKRSSSDHQQFDKQMWGNVLSELKGQHNTLYGITRMAKPRIKDNTLELAFAFSFHQRRCNEQRNKSRIAATVEAVAGQNYDIVCVVDKSIETNVSPEPKATEPDHSESDILDSVTNIFGGGEVLDS